MLRTVTAIRNLAAHLPDDVVVVDIGCRWGFAPHWESLVPHVALFGLDADPDEIARLQDTFGSEEHMHFDARVLDAAPGTRTLRHTREPGGTSLFRPDSARTAHLPAEEGARVLSETTVRTSTLDAWMGERSLTRVDALKLDTQGAELEILNGAHAALATARHIEIELAFNELFEGAPLYGEVDAILRSQGFVLWRFRDLVSYGLRKASWSPTATVQLWHDSRAQSVVIPGGQVMWCNAHYVRRDAYEPASESRLRDACLFAAVELDELAAIALEELLVDSEVGRDIRDQAGRLLSQLRFRTDAMTPMRMADRVHEHPEFPSESTELRRLKTDLAASRELVDAMETTVSWRVTRPLRAAQRLRRRLTARHASEPPVSSSVRQDAKRAIETQMAQRINLVIPLLDATTDGRADGQVTFDEAVGRFERATAHTQLGTSAASWLGFVAFTGGYPASLEHEEIEWILRTRGSLALTTALVERFAPMLRAARPASRDVEIVRDRVLVDASQILGSNVHTGIQRVARETVSRWLALEPSVQLVYFDHHSATLHLVDESERERLMAWQSLENISSRELVERTPSISARALVPWGCTLIAVELPQPAHSRALRTLRASGALRSLSLIGFDLIPLVAPELVVQDLSVAFLDFVSLVKHADRISAISTQSKRDFAALASTLEGEGLRRPSIETHTLPVTAPSLTEADVKDARASLGFSGVPLVVVVGGHEARKNHLAVLEAAEGIWTSGYTFELLFIGGCVPGTPGGFDRELARLADHGRQVRVRRRASEQELWAAYALARFTVFPSLVEGFGLPIAESLASGTPVITSNYGAMAEVAKGGGALLVDPRNVDELEEQMRRLLTDDELLGRLEREARSRDFGSWDRYAEDIWSFLVGNDRDRPTSPLLAPGPPVARRRQSGARDPRPSDGA